MTKKEQIYQAFKKLLGHFEDAPVDKVYTEDELKISQREVGAKVELVDAEGNMTTAPDGEYQLGDGFKFTVKDGLIQAIEGEQPQEETQAEEAVVEAAEEEAPTQEEEAPAEPSELDAMKGEVEALKEIIADLSKRLEELQSTAATKEEVSEFTSQVVELNKNIVALAKVPAQFSQTSTDVKVKENKTVQLSALANVIGAARK